jgi:mono/diheme cytochrome c family protein
MEPERVLLERVAQGHVAGGRVTARGAAFMTRALRRARTAARGDGGPHFAIGIAVVVIFGGTLLLGAGCRGRGGGSPARDAAAARPWGAQADAGRAPAPPVVTAAEGRALVVDNCLSCHAEEMLEQQRLTAAQWGNVVKKMTGWGAPIEPERSAALVAYLAATYGSNAGPYAARSIDAAKAATQLAPLEDGPFAGGDAARGRAIYAARCAACHGPDGKGALGVNVVDRPMLDRAAELARLVRNGQGRMAAQPATTDREVADLVAHLRRL